MINIHSIKDHIPEPTWASVYSSVIEKLQTRKNCQSACGIVKQMARKEMIKQGV